MLGRNDENIQGGGHPLLRGLGRGLRRALGACLAVAALIAATAGGAYADDLPATRDAGATAGAARKDVDGDTRYTYTGDDGSGVLGDETSTRYSGRVWTDKTVTKTGQTFTNRNDPQDGTTVTVDNDSDFLVTYSALATTTRYVEDHPTDTVFVLDFSESMVQAMDGSYILGQGREKDYTRISETRMALMLQALDSAIAALSGDNSSNRVGIVVFYGNNIGNQTGRVMLPLTDVDQLDVQKPITGGNIGYTTNGGRFTITEGGWDQLAASKTYLKVQCNLPGGQEYQTGHYTPIQEGLYDGMTMLGNATIDGSQRFPNIVLMTDGMTNSVNVTSDGNWYDIGEPGNATRNHSQRLYSGPPTGWTPAIFGTILMGSYAKTKLEQHYGSDCTIYTIGVTDQNNVMERMQFELDPGDITANTSADSVINRVKEYLEQYSETDTPTVTTSENEKYQFTIVKDGNQTVPADFDYAEKYYHATSADELAQAFQDIAGQIVTSAKVPTQVTGDPDLDGYITYTDPIGQYMEVKNVKTLIYMGREYSNPSPSSTTDSDGNTVKTYTFHGQVDSPAYPGAQTDLGVIKITVSEDGSTRGQTLTVSIPASAIPIRENSLIVDTVTGEAHQNTPSAAQLPLRLCYTVGLRDDVNRYSLAGVDQTYVNANKTDDGTVLFYSNAFTKDNEGRIKAGATVKFTPAKDNPFYYIQENTPLYVGGNAGVIGQGGLTGELATVFDRDTTYYFPITYYEGTTRVERVIARHGSQLEGHTTTDDGPLCIMKGEPRLGNLGDVTANKQQGDNPTETAKTYREPTWDEQNQRFVVYLGNNGRLGIKAATPGTVAATVRKKLKGREWMDDETFRFTITPTKGGPLPTGDGIKPNSDGTAATLTIKKPSKGDTNTASMTFTFPAETDFNGQSQIIYTYTVTEIKGNQPSIDWDNHTATITITVKPDDDDADLALNVEPPVYDNQTASEEGNDSTDAAAFTNTFKPVSSLPLTGDGTTARNLLAAGGLTLMLAGAAWLLARRRA